MPIIERFADALIKGVTGALTLGTFNERLCDEIQANLNLLQQVDFTMLTDKQVCLIASRLDYTNINSYLNHYKRIRRLICGTSVTEKLLGKLKAKRTIGKHLDDILRSTRFMKNSLSNADIVHILNPKQRIKNLITYNTIALRLLKRVKSKK